MSTNRTVVGDTDQNHSASKSGYIVGYILALVITLTAYMLVEAHNNSGHEFSRVFVFVSIACLAFIQFIVQLLFFLHLGRETKPRWKILVFFGMLTVVIILVAGSLWIMHNLNYRMMPSQAKVNQYLQGEDGGL